MDDCRMPHTQSSRIYHGATDEYALQAKYLG